MDNRVQFDEEAQAQVPIPRPKNFTMTDMLMHSGIASRSGDAAIMLAIVAFCLIAGAIYFLASAVPQQPTLGHDILRSGETVPGYVR